MDSAFVDEFRRTIGAAVSRLAGYSDADASRPRAPGKWSRKEIVGHLIDSAANNHARFIRGQLHDDLVFEGYDQVRWVEVQHYREKPWADLVRLWEAYNLHIAWLMEKADAAALARPRARHNLDAVAMHPVDRAEPATLDYFMRDYVEHLKHHLRQVFGED